MCFNLRGVDLCDDLLMVPRLECEILRIERDLLYLLNFFITDDGLHLIVRVVDN